MAEFDPAVEYILREEGGYSNDPRDAGGETNFGISKRWHPDVDVKNLTREQAVNLYFDKWVKHRWRELDDQRLADRVFSASVLIGPAMAIRCLQRALRAVEEPVEEDGRLGPITVGACNSMHAEIGEPLALVAAFRSEFAAHVRQFKSETWGKGWLNRAYR